VIARAELQKRLLAALSARPEIHAIYAFGRQVMGPLDEYSDLDLVICSRDLEKTRSEYPSIFSTISPIRAQLILLNQSDVYAAMSLLRDVAPYQKIDFSIVSDIEMQARFGPFQTLYQDDKKEGAGAALKILTFTDDLQNQLNDVLFSIPRFTKCLFRRDFYQYQRWQGVLNRALGLLYEKHFEPATSKLNSRQYQEMNAVLSETEKRTLVTLMPLDGPLDITTSFRAGVDLVTDLCREKAAKLNALLDEDVIHYMHTFLASEIRCFRQS
jgi:hypothetical protein